MPSTEELVAHFSSRLAFETDASDVHSAIEDSARFVLVDVRGQSSLNHALETYPFFEFVKFEIVCKWIFGKERAE